MERRLRHRLVRRKPHEPSHLMNMVSIFSLEFCFLFDFVAFFLFLVPAEKRTRGGSSKVILKQARK